MKIEEVISILVLSFNGKKYKRIAHLNPDGTERVEWKSKGSNHTLNKSKSKELENEYDLMTGKKIKNPNVSKSVLNMRTEDINKINNKIIPLLKKGMLINAVKNVKEMTGWGLKEAKDYTDSVRDSLKKRGVIS